MRYLIQLNGKTIDECASERISDMIWDAFTNQFDGKIHYCGSKLTRKEWEESQCERLGIDKFSGAMIQYYEDREGKLRPINEVELLPILEVKFHSEERGFCRKYYRPTDKNDKRLLCLQEDYPGEWHTYECTPSGEPDHEISRKLVVV